MIRTRIQYRWVILFMVYMCMLVFAFTLQFLPPILPSIIADFQLSHTQAGLLMSLFTLPSIFLAILAGLLSDKWGTYKVGLLSLVFVLAGTLIFIFSRTLFLAGFGRIITGTGAVTLTIAAAKILSQWFQGKEVGAAMGVYNTAMPVGSIICFSTFGQLAAKVGWRTPVYITAAVCLVGLVVFIVFNKRPPEESHHAELNRTENKSILANILFTFGLVWMAALCWLLFNAAVISFSTFAPDFFVSQGETVGRAGFLTSLLMWGSLALSPVIGRLIDKFNSNSIFIGAGGLVLALSLVLVTRASSFFPPMAMMAVAVAFVPTPVFSYLSKNLPQKDLGLGFGILGMVSGIGMFFGPVLSGLIRDKTGSYGTPFLFLSALALLITVVAFTFFLREKKKNSGSVRSTKG